MVTKQTRYKEGKRPFAMTVPVPATALFQRLCGEVKSGDTIEITVETEWTDDSYHTRLVAFCPEQQLVPAGLS
jgi:hypothetical protein